jgi:hypothetical protein
MNVEGVFRRFKSLSAGAGTALAILLLALVMALTVAAADAPAPGQLPSICNGACSPAVIERDSPAPARPFDEPVAVVFLPLMRGGSDDRIWDPRLDDLGVYLEPAVTTSGEPYWRLVEARWADPDQAGGDHTIHIDVLDSGGDRAMGQEVRVGWSDSNSTLIIDKPPNEPWGADFPMYGTLGSYDVLGQGLPSDRIYGLGLGTAEEPDLKHHTNFYLIFRRVVK